MRRALRAGLGAVVVASGLLSVAGAIPAGAPLTEEVARLGAELSELLETARWRSSRWSVLVVSLDQGDTLFAFEPDAPRVPASNMKLLTSAAALRELGPDFRFRTYLVSDGDVRDGVLSGDLVLYGTGDPGISDRFYATKEAVFESLADQLRARGVTAVDGNLVGDASFLPGPLRPAGWEPDDMNDHFAAAVSALSFNENVVSLRVEPAIRTGWRPVVHTIPANAGLDVDNRALTVEGRGRLLVQRDEPTEPILVVGDIQRGGRDVWRQLTVSDPAAFAVSVLRGVLEAKGIRVLGTEEVLREETSSLVGGRRLTAPSRPAPRARILATHVSPPLLDYLSVVNKKSNNLYTELLFRTLGRVREGPADPAAASRAVVRSLTPLGVDFDGVVVDDGSGLSAGNRVAARTLVQVLEGMAATDQWDDFWATLPEAGNRRELPRMYRSAAAGNLRAKTGTIEGVSALSGVVTSQDGERLAFSILVNGTPSTTRAKRVENDIGERLASFARGSGRPAAVRLAQAPSTEDVTRVERSRHLVAAGESFEGIARDFGVTLEELLRANPGVEPRRLRAGSWIVIPSPDADTDRP